MATTAFICDMVDSEGSVESHQIKQRVHSYTLLQVLVTVLTVLVLALTGGIIWVMFSQNCSERNWTIRFNGTDTNFTSPESGEYVIFGKVFTEKNPENNLTSNSFKMLQKRPEENQSDESKDEIMRKHIAEQFMEIVKLEKGAGLRIQLNINDMKIDEAKSILIVYQKIF